MHTAFRMLRLNWATVLIRLKGSALVVPMGKSRSLCYPPNTLVEKGLDYPMAGTFPIRASDSSASLSSCSFRQCRSKSHHHDHPKRRAYPFDRLRSDHPVRCYQGITSAIGGPAAASGRKMGA
jgi:hypothetical protein